MKYLLINPPIHDVMPFVGMSQPTHLLRIGALLKAQGHTVRLFDYEPIHMTGPDRVSEASGMRRLPKKTGIVKSLGQTDAACRLSRYGKEREELEAFLAAIEKPDRILITSMMTFHYRGVYEVVDVCKKIYPDVHVTVGGIYASLCPDHARLSGADEVFTGEIPDANLTKPDMDLLEHPPEYAILKTRWGCPNRCSYCAVHQLEGRKIRSAPPDLVFRHIRELHADHGLRYFYFWDSNTLVNWNGHLGPILDNIRKSGLDVKIEFTYGFQPNLLTPDICRRMKDAGVADIFPLPIESVDEKLCGKRFHRRSTLDDLKRAVDMLRDVGYANFMFYVLTGMPEQSFESVLQSCELAWELGGKPIILPFTPIPGTEEYKNYRHLIDGKDLEDLMPGLMPFCCDESQLNDLLQLREYSMRTLEETKAFLASNLHVRTWRKFSETPDAFFGGSTT